VITNTARRLIIDVGAVCKHASPASAARWATSLALHAPGCLSARSLVPADRAWARGGASFRAAHGLTVSVPPAFTAGAREMYCRNVYLRTGLTMPTDGWVVDLGANCGLFSVWAALSGTHVVAVEAQQGFAWRIEELARHNNVADRVHVELAMAGGVKTAGSSVGILADDLRWAAASHSAPVRPASASVPGLIAKYQIDRISLLKIDIEGGEFAVLSSEENLDWLQRVNQLVLELHPGFGDSNALMARIRAHGFAVDPRDNDGRRRDATSPSIDYVYCRRC
jgi:FkbM family methyltransferase